MCSFNQLLRHKFSACSTEPDTSARGTGTQRAVTATEIPVLPQWTSPTRRHGGAASTRHRHPLFPWGLSSFFLLRFNSQALIPHFLIKLAGTSRLEMCRVTSEYYFSASLSAGARHNVHRKESPLWQTQTWENLFQAPSGVTFLSPSRRNSPWPRRPCPSLRHHYFSKPQTVKRTGVALACSVAPVCCTYTYL